MEASRKKYLFGAVVLIFLAALGAGPARADSVFGQFSITNNPNGNWSYGHSTATSPFVLHTFHTDYAIEFGQGLGSNGPVLPRWVDPTGITSGYVLANTLGPIQTDWSTIPANVVILGAGYTFLDQQAAVVRWTAPATGTYTINGFFQGLNNFWYPSVNTVNIMLNGNLLFSGPMDANGPGSVLPFALSQYVQAGSYVDFTASGSQYTFPANLIGLSADVYLAPVPEPGTMILLGTGLLGIATRARRRKA